MWWYLKLKWEQDTDWETRNGEMLGMVCLQVKSSWKQFRSPFLVMFVLCNACICVHICVCIYVWRPERNLSCSNKLSVLFLFFSPSLPSFCPFLETLCHCVASNSQTSTCFCLPCAGIRAHQFVPNSTVFIHQLTCFVFKAASLIDLELTNWARLVASDPQGSGCLYLPILVVKEHHIGFLFVSVFLRKCLTM